MAQTVMITREKCALSFNRNAMANKASQVKTQLWIISLKPANNVRPRHWEYTPMLWLKTTSNRPPRIPSI